MPCKKHLLPHDTYKNELHTQENSVLLVISFHLISSPSCHTKGQKDHHIPEAQTLNLWSIQTSVPLGNCHLLKNWTCLFNMLYRNNGLVCFFFKLNLERCCYAWAISLRIFNFFIAGELIECMEIDCAALKS